MRNHIFGLLCLLIAAVPAGVSAQKNIQSAFDAIIKTSKAVADERHSLERDPDTGAKEGQCDIYRFVLPKDKINLIRNAVSAFDKDSKTAYSISSGSYEINGSNEALAIGDGKSSEFVSEPGCEYIYALFLAPKSESPDGRYRYAYSLAYKEDGNKIKGKILVTYATTLKYRQDQQNRQLRSLPNSAMFGVQQGWFDTLMSYLQSMGSANTQTQIALATRMYKHINALSEYTDVSEQDKTTAREIIKAMISDPQYSDTVLNKLLTQCLVSLKK